MKGTAWRNCRKSKKRIVLIGFGVFALLSLMILSGCAKKLSIGMIGTSSKPKSAKYYVLSDATLAENELEELTYVVEKRAQIADKNAIVKSGKDSKGDFIQVEFPAGTPDSVFKLLEERSEVKFILSRGEEKEEEILKGAKFKSVEPYAYTDMNANANYVLLLTLDETGTEEFAKVTSEHKGEKVTILLDGVVIYEPIIQDTIKDGRVMVTEVERGGLTDIASLIMSSGQEYDIKR